MLRRPAQSFRYSICMELIFEVREAEEGGYVARALGQAIFTEAETWAELRDNVLEVTRRSAQDRNISRNSCRSGHSPVRFHPRHRRPV